MANWTLIAFKLHEEVGGSPLKGMSAGMKKILTGSSFLRVSQIDISPVGTLWAGGESIRSPGETRNNIWQQRGSAFGHFQENKKKCQVVLKNTVGKLYE